MADWTWQQEAVKAGFSAGVSAVTLALGWFVGQQLTAKWTLRQKRRELELSAAGELYRLYGEFFAVWKLWNYFKDGKVSAEKEDIRLNLMQRAALVDAGIEALLVKVTSERVLTTKELENLGLLRQAFQRLRESIKKEQSLDWYYSEHPEYLEFKRLACLLSNMLISDHSYEQPDARTAASALTRITSNEFEGRWNQIRSKPSGRRGSAV